MLGRAFLVVSVLFVGLLAFAFYQDFNRPYGPIQQQYAAKYGADFQVGNIQQLFPKVQVNGNFQVERCITCHVPDIAKIGPQEAASRLGPNHPAVINDAVFAKYGQDTLICRPATAGATTTVTASPSPAGAGASPTPKASGSPTPGGPASPSPASSGGVAANPSPAPSTSLKCQNPNATPYYVLDVNGKQVLDPTTGKPQIAQLTGFIPSQYKGLGIDETGCVICHNGNRQATTQDGAHQNLVPNPFAVYDQAPQLYENSCAQCHGAVGEGLKGPPLNDQDRLGFFNDDYYHRCIFAGNLGSEHLGSIMPPWGIKHLLSSSQIDLLVHWIRLWQQYTSLP
ncbi:MAG TPA: c-type cytochrome [Candidatus Limnocylindrales bacterium]|nr:c-type cytochrome [Candidatus Limnocylindrales bacterium]